MSTAACRPPSAVATNWKPFAKNTLVGFFSLQLASGMIVHNLSLHTKNDHSWIGMPGQKYVKDDGTVGYVPIVEFADRATADRFRDLALTALKDLGVAL